MTASRVIGLAALSLSLLAPCASARADRQENQIIGDWVTSAKDGVVRIRKLDGGDQYEGSIVAGPKPSRVDEKNPEPGLRGRPLLGATILSGLHYDGHGKWPDGTIYDPDNGKTYHCELTMKDAHTLQVRGYIGTPLLGRTETWTRQGE